MFYIRWCLPDIWKNVRFCRSGGLVCSMLYVIKNEISFCVNICMYLYSIQYPHLHAFTCIHYVFINLYLYTKLYHIYILIHPNPTLSVVFCWLPRSLVAYTSSSSSLKAVFAWGEKCASQAKTHESWKKEQKNQEPLIFPLVVQVCVILLIWVVVSNIFIFTPIWGRFPFWQIFFKEVETTNW